MLAAMRADGVDADVGRSDDDSDSDVDGVPDTGSHLTYHMVGEQRGISRRKVQPNRKLHSVYHGKHASGLHICYLQDGSNKDNATITKGSPAGSR